jgi:hypothetical protein
MSLSEVPPFKAIQPFGLTEKGPFSAQPQSHFRQLITQVVVSIPFLKTIPGLALWIDATNVSSFVTNGTVTLGSSTYSTMATIYDSAYGSLSSQALFASSPSYIPSVNLSFITWQSTSAGKTHNITSNNLPAFLFQGRRLTSQCHSWNINQSNKPMTLFFVGTCTDEAVIIGTADLDYDFILGYGNCYDSSIGGTATDIRTKPYASYANAIMETVGDDGSNNWYLRFNGTKLGQITSSGIHGLSNVRIGRPNGENATVIMHEMIYFSTALTSAQITSVESYLTTKWNLNLQA